MPDEQYELRIRGVRELVNPFKMAPPQTGFFNFSWIYESETLRRAQIPLVGENVRAAQTEFGQSHLVTTGYQQPHRNIEPRFRTMVRPTSICFFGHEVQKRSPRP